MEARDVVNIAQEDSTRPPDLLSREGNERFAEDVFASAS